MKRNSEDEGWITVDIRKILSHTDHTLLRPDAGWNEIRNVCNEAMEFGCASVCIPPAFVRRASEYVNGNMKICTVIGFPNGYSTLASKVFETRDAVDNGADEIDMVINLGMVKDCQWDELTQEIMAVKTACLGRTLKVIIETCRLTSLEIIRLCQVCRIAGADYVKTSTGFSDYGATPEDVELIRQNLPETMHVKASGGIRSLEDADVYLRLGAERLGASALIEEARKEVKKQ